MKTIKKIGLALLIGIAGFYGCEKSDLKPDRPAAEATERITELPLWRISSYQWHNKANNDHFEHYAFRFDNEGRFLAIHDNAEEYGTWARKDDILIIEFPRAPLVELNNNWTVIEQSRDHMTLKGLNLYDHSSELVQFSRMGSRESK